jgi:hypothetical protein
MQKMELGEHLDTFFHSQLSKIEAAIAFWALAWQKTSSVQTLIDFLLCVGIPVCVAG